MEMVSRSIFEASKQLVSGGEENGIVQTLLRFSLDISGAAGASFVPLDERGLPLAVILQGDIPESVSECMVGVSCLSFGPYEMQPVQFITAGSKNLASYFRDLFAESSGVYCLPVRMRIMIWVL